MTGFKYKVGHKRADSDKWSASDNAQRKRLVKFLRELVDSIENGESIAGETPDVEVRTPVRKSAAKTRRAPAKKPATRKRRAVAI
jgi:hypothetical protein